MAVIEQNIIAKWFQWQFFKLLKRFPCFLAGWGTGKTMWGLQKGILLSKFYKNNLGLIVRSKYTDLRDSTMKDFTRYTKYHVPQGTKEITFEDSGSQILFRHAKELSGLQNINIGWFYMEQAEEFPTDTQFTLLRGRLRRELEWNPAFEIEENNPMYKELCSMRDNPLRQGLVIANSKGHNWVWKKWVKNPQPGYRCIQATTFDNAENLPKDFVDDLEKMKVDSPAKYQQYVMNNHAEVDYEAAYYAESISHLRKRGQICSVPYDPAGLVYTSWDLGFDGTALWFYQIVGREIHIIDYYENTGKGIQHYLDVLLYKKKTDNYRYGKFFMPHDANKREMQSGISLSEAIKKEGFEVHTFEQEINVDFGINRVLETLPRCWFDEEKCEKGIEMLENYQREYNEELQVYMGKPLHDLTSHGADSFRYLTKSLSSSTASGMTKSRVKELHAQYGY